MGQCARMTVIAMGIDADGRMMVSTNGSDSNECTGEQGKCGCTHAEERLLDRMPNPTIVVLSHSPCPSCARLLVLRGVRHVIYSTPYRLQEGINYMQSHGVEVTYLSD